MRQIVTCTGHGGTGSSFITDFFKEFENVKSTGDFEFTLSYDVDGIYDLYHNISHYSGFHIAESFDRLINCVVIFVNRIKIHWDVIYILC
ncbi:hypothetical protein ACIXNW_11085 [Bacteroides fragilis]